MQISLDIQDDVYKKLVNAGVDMQSKFNEYLTTLSNKKDTYSNSQQFQDDKKYFHDTLKDIESGKARLVSHNEVWEEIEKHTSSH